jgi:NAD(P)-dependent dehydrogenase (short-subunit alcohol dehydrogenase family)
VFSRHDVTIDEQWRDIVAQVDREQGRLSILVNNAGIVGSYEGIETVSLEDYNRIIAINQTGVFLGMRHCAPLMRKGRRGVYHQHLEYLGPRWGSRRRAISGEQRRGYSHD